MWEREILFMCVGRKHLERLSHLCIFSCINRKCDLITKTGLSCSLFSRVNVYWSRKTWACKFWFVCACCLRQSRCGVESITIGMWTWLLQRLWKSHRPMIKNSVQDSLQPHHSGCLHNRNRALQENHLVLAQSPPSRQRFLPIWTLQGIF